MSRPLRTVPARLLALALAAVTLTACGQAPAAQQAQPSAAAPQAGFPVTIENCGRKLTFDRPPAKVVTGYHPSLETLLALGLGDRIAGRTYFGESAFLPGQKEQYDRIPQISETIMLPQKEVMLAQGADFVLDNAMASFDAAGGYATVAELDAAGSPVYILGGWCSPEETLQYTLDETFTDIQNLGRIFGVPDRAEQLVSQLRGSLADVKQRVGGRTPVKVLATDGGKGPVNAYGGSGITDQLITAAGGENVLKDVKGDYTEVSVERVSAAQPEAVLVSDYATLRGEDMPSSPAKAEETFAIARNSPAAKEKRYLALPVAAQHPGYRNILAVAEIARFLHPDAFAQ
ncbi:ABC transporter substrate-binding protein [Nonomuraea gerenzanensis]|uniref:ABC transporter (Iron.B12.siderophore.hemin), periplasmic substrate-binding component n=1 Tax=Nonomuraea gerenzanensis TaxID=93944 RepID=A0A1M4EG39_9ACTN|nr:ABC transporter substrate-binding protein [Nonomuraea gerenzanensis]UBU09341.1 ABC transporter substrate-binding protein [Nonomuraea gerenzanensis]SBO97754.1 ABC transporter (iron.B12.siderophore.hemin), periplasmic substrate-binding component [Nonomuraea gerenzanensis]